MILLERQKYNNILQKRNPPDFSGGPLTLYSKKQFTLGLIFKYYSAAKAAA
jgi:hypothetical protein